MLETYSLNNAWTMQVDPDSPGDTFKVYRPDGQYFTIEFSAKKWGQPVIKQQGDDKGITGSVISVVQKVKGEWKVVVTKNDRIANDYTEPLIEGARSSVSNTQPFLDVRGYPIVLLSGYNHADSARIQDKTVFGIILDHSGTFPLPSSAFTMSFSEFFRTSTDTMTKACLGQFMVEVLGVI